MHSIPKYILLFFLLVLSQNEGVDCLNGSCRSRCCEGRDASCRGVINTNYPRNYLRNFNEVHGKNKVCYCDQGCLETRDCCPDYKHYCSVQVVDCEVSAWSEWSSCSSSCGRGRQRRSRVVVRHPSPAGRRCDALTQKRRCSGSRCDNSFYNKPKSAAIETAVLLPAKYLRRFSRKSWDVRSNLFARQEKLKMINNNNDIEGYQSDQASLDENALGGSGSYCIVFKLERVTRACLEDEDFYRMQRGREMCALCPEDAKRAELGDRCRGHGVNRRRTPWRSTVKPRCHGKWKREYELSKCPCQNGADFIFV